MLRERALGIVAASLAVALLGCPPQDENRSGRRTSDDEVLTAGQVIGVARAINTGEIDAANAVRSRLPDGPASGYADMMLKDHQKSLQDLERVSVSLSLVPEDSEVMRELQEDVEKTVGGYADKEQAELADDYLESQIDMHEKALKVIDDELVPVTTEPTLTEYLGKMRACVVHHLEAARQLKDEDVREHQGVTDPERRQEKWDDEQKAREEDAEDVQEDAEKRREDAREDAEDAREDAGERRGTQSETGEPSGHMEGRPYDRTRDEPARETTPR